MSESFDAYWRRYARCTIRAASDWYGRRNQVKDRVDYTFVDPHLEVQVRSRGEAGRALEPDPLASRYAVTDAHVGLHQVGVQGDDPAAVGDHHVVPVADDGVGDGHHHAVVGRQ